MIVVFIYVILLSKFRSVTDSDWFLLFGNFTTMVDEMATADDLLAGIAKVQTISHNNLVLVSALVFLM